MYINSFSTPAYAKQTNKQPVPQFGMAWGRVTEETAHRLPGVMNRLTPATQVVREGTRPTVAQGLGALVESFASGNRKGDVFSKAAKSLRERNARVTVNTNPTAHIIQPDSDRVGVAAGNAAVTAKHMGKTQVRENLPELLKEGKGYAEFKVPPYDKQHLVGVQGVRELVTDVQAGSPYKILRGRGGRPLGTATKDHLDTTTSMRALGHSDEEIAKVLDAQPANPRKSTTTTTETTTMRPIAGPIGGDGANADIRSRSKESLT